MALVTTLFVLANLGYFAVLGEDRVLQSEAVAVVRNIENSIKLSYHANIGFLEAVPYSNICKGSLLVIVRKLTK